jgi:L-ascorbate metabolism protein UlaG (beta-lactamase superfamily)
MAASNVKFGASLAITHIGTATAIIHVDGINLLTDPVFSPAGTEWDLGGIMLKISDTPVKGLADLPHIDAVLLSHEDHWDNLDDLGRRLLDGRRVFTTLDGAKNLAPRPAVHGFHPWETIKSTIAGTEFSITGVPCIHFPGQECSKSQIRAARFPHI